MIVTQLLTRTGDFVTSVAVPPFHPEAEIIVWGSRSFVLTTQGEYREAVVWVAMDAPQQPR